MNYCPAPSPDNERERIQTLLAYEIVDTEPEALFDELTDVAARICDTPIALIGLIDRRRQWYKSRVGIAAEETPRELIFCTHALPKTEILEVPDAVANKRFADHPLVTGEPKIRFYAGVPLIAPNRCVIGTLCVVDYTPRRLTKHQLKSLETLARAVVAELELRKHARQLATALKERNAAQVALRRTNEQLEARVAQRTATLSALNNALTSEIAARREAESKIRELAMHDALTGLPNRLLFVDRLQQQIALSKRQHVLIAVLFIDLDGFKPINDTYGHQAGDALLIETAQRLPLCIREGDVVARLSATSSSPPSTVFHRDATLRISRERFSPPRPSPASSKTRSSASPRASARVFFRPTPPNRMGSSKRPTKRCIRQRARAKILIAISRPPTDESQP